MDCLFINPNSSHIYQDLAKDNTAIEVPVWSLLLAQALRNEFGVAILDCDAERLTDEEALQRVMDLNPKMVCFVVYGQNPNSGTTNMTGAISLAKLIREHTGIKISFIGSHTSALPGEVLAYKCVDFVMVGDGLNALKQLLKTDLKTDLHKIDGLGWKQLGLPQFNQSGCSVSNLDEELPGYAWDLLPKKDKPFDLYRSHFWHANFNKEKRKNAASLYTSLGCVKKCNFCMINSVRKNTLDNTTADNFNKMAYWSPETVIGWFKELANLGVKTVRLSDELFFLNRKYYEPLLEGLIREGLQFHMWAYSRVDTVKEEFLPLFNEAGIKWLAFGIESANQSVRQEIDKGKFQDVDIRHVINTTRDAGINVIGNYLYGLPDDNWNTMQETLNLALELNTEMYNGYATQALPGSPLYNEAINNNWDLPDSFEGYSFHSYECKPLRTKYLEAKDVLAFRDYAWQTYMTNPRYLNLVQSKFGEEAVNNIKAMSQITLRRKLLENNIL